jgi:riboflavin synthase
MFTGIIEKTVSVVGVADGPMFRRVNLPAVWDDVKLGESIAINGVCLTVAEMPDGLLSFDVVQETLSKTNLGLLNNGDSVHVERSMRLGDRIDGHFVQGHVDGMATLREQVTRDNEWRLALEAPDALAKYLAPKGSIALDGVSLTIAAVERNRFEVALIPTTLNLTMLGKRPIGWPYNLETDMLSRTIVSWLEQRKLSPLPPGEG